MLTCSYIQCVRPYSNFIYVSLWAAYIHMLAFLQADKEHASSEGAVNVNLLKPVCAIPSRCCTYSYSCINNPYT
jgi:hypothetical protein